MPPSQIQITDDLDLLLEVLPPAIRAALERQESLVQLLEVVLDLGRLPEARVPGAVVYLSRNHTGRE
ncbi:MAG: hypothetical protein ACRDF5_00795, partial [bacterium]